MFVRPPDPANTTIVFWLPGFDDTFYHQHVLAFQRCDVLMLHFKDYMPVSEGVEVDLSLTPHLRDYERPTLPHATEDFYQYFPEIDRLMSPHFRARKYERYVLYGHSTGGLIATLYAYRGRYAPCLSAMILNDPYYDLNRPWSEPVLQFLALAPISYRWSWKRLNLFYTKEANLIRDDADFKREIKESGYQVPDLILDEFEVPTGFINACTHFQNLLRDTKRPLVSVPTLLMVADGEHTFLNPERLISIASNALSNVSVLRCPNTIHDVLFPISEGSPDQSTLSNISSRITEFIGAQTTPPHRIILLEYPDNSIDGMSYASVVLFKVMKAIIG